jgi:signal transduction histidine kinase
MPRNPWLAIDAVTPPARRARELRHEWEKFVTEGRVNGGVRVPVADSWRRSLGAGVDPLGSRLAPLTADRRDAWARWEMHPLAQAEPLILDRLASIADRSDHLIVISDATGLLLQLAGNARVRSQAADSMNFTEGALWSEDGAGTNAVGTALAADHAVQIFATEHFVEVVQAWTCSAAPVHDPETGELLGVIDLTGLRKNVHPRSLEVVVTTARAVEAHLRGRLQERDDRLRARYQGHLTGGADRRALVAPTGRLIGDDSRGWLRGARLELPPGGGELILPSGTHAFADPVGHEEAFIVRELAGPRAPRRHPLDELRMLADERAALRRVATLVARGVPPPEVFAAVAQEVGQLLGVDVTHMGRYDAEGRATVVGSWSTDGTHLSVGTFGTLDGSSVTGLVFRTCQPARRDHHGATGPIAELTREMGIRSSVGAPIVVAEQLWGVMIASSKADEPLPADTESRIAGFTELVATAISTTEARVDVGRLAEEQAALRRVATLVAQDVPPGELFGAVAQEVGTLLRADLAGMIRYETEDTVTAVATWAAADDHADVEGRWRLDRGGLGMTISRTGRPARVESWHDLPGRVAAFVREELGVHSSVGSPIVVEGRLWGALIVHSTQAEPLAADTESRLENFTELVATAMSNAQARTEVRRLADEQAALRRVATLVARQSPPARIFAAVAEEVGRILGVEHTEMCRYGADRTATLVADWGEPDAVVPVGTRRALEGHNVLSLVHRTGRPVRIDDYASATGFIGKRARELGIRSAVGAPIVVEGRLWGVIIAASRQPEPLPAGIESRMGEFTELAATAIANTQARSDLAASRARIVAATDEERRRVARDLHDGAQQRLVHTVLTLRLARRALENEEADAAALVTEALHEAELGTAELRELAHGILPSVLRHGGLRAGVGALASRTPVPVEIGMFVDRLPAPVEASAYFVVAEALTNVAKHSRATRVEVTAREKDGTLEVQVRDDGVGGARTDGSGLQGLADRLASLDGRLRVESPSGGGTLVAAAIPLPA